MNLVVVSRVHGLERITYWPIPCIEASRFEVSIVYRKSGRDISLSARRMYARVMKTRLRVCALCNGWVRFSCKITSVAWGYMQYALRRAKLWTPPFFFFLIFEHDGL
jgi:hypothetical protein